MNTYKSSFRSLVKDYPQLKETLASFLNNADRYINWLDDDRFEANFDIEKTCQRMNKLLQN